MNEALTQKLSAVLQRSLPKNYTSFPVISYKGQILCADSLGYQDGSKLHPGHHQLSFQRGLCLQDLLHHGCDAIGGAGRSRTWTPPIVEYLPDFKMLDERYRQIHPAPLPEPHQRPARHPVEALSHCRCQAKTTTMKKSVLITWPTAT